MGAGKTVKGGIELVETFLKELNKPAALKVKPPSDNIAVVKSANFDYPKVIGNQTLKVNDVSGGVRMSDPYERKRVQALAQKMSSPNGYISRIIVDHNNNVIEGQHRLEALRHLGIEDVPVYKIEDLSDTMPVASMESALNAVAPIHPDHVNQLIGHALEDISEHGIDHARTLDYGKYQKFYDAALDAAFPDLTKASGGEVHMMGGGRPPKKTTLEEDLKSFKDPAMALADLLAGALRGTTTAATGFAGDMEELYRQYGKGAISNAVRLLLPKREGKATTFPTIEEMNAMLPPVVPKGASRSTQVADVGQFLGENNPAAPTALAAVKPVARAVKAAAPIIKAGALDLARSDAAYNLANKVASATGAAPKQIMMGPKSRTYRHADAARAEQMEKEGKNRDEIWQATKTMKAPDNEFRQELSDLAMRYNSNTAKDRQFEAEKQRFLQAASRAKSLEELDDAEKHFEKQTLNLLNNPSGKAQEFVEHPELFEAYPELSNYVFRQLEPTNSQFTAPETVNGYYSPGAQRITINSNAPNKRSTALHELQHAIQEIEGWQGGSSPEEMAAKLADRDIAKTREADLQKLIQEMQLTLPASQNNLILTEGQKLKNIQDFLNKTKQLEGETDPYDAYRKVSGEEEARMVQERRNYPEEKLAERPPYLDYETDPSLHITEFADGGAVMMGAGGTVKKGIELVDTFLNALKEGEKAATAADRAAAGRAGAALIKATPQVKASEALGQAMEEGFKKTTTTQSDRTRVGGGNIGGAPFSAISEADPRYAGKVWGVMDQGTASRLANLTSPDTAWSTMLGSATQLKTNPVVFAKLEKQFKKGLKEGRLQPELEGKINQNLGLFLGEGANIRDPEIWKILDTFEKRAAMADIMMGKGVPPSKGGVPLGGEKSGKGVIFNPTETLIEETERGLLHPEHGGYVPTFAVGPRLFSLTGESSFRPDLHPGFPTLLEGKDLGVNMMATPTEVYLPDWHARFKANNPDRQGPGYYDLALGVKGEGLPSQELTDDYIRHLIREGYAEGGEVNADEDGITIDEFLSKQGY